MPDKIVPEKNFDPQPNFPQMEEEVLKFWEKGEIFRRSVEQRKGGKPFVFFEGPPTANAKPALHHVAARAFKDLIPRFQTMRGKHVLRKAGWDTHGLPVELQIEKALGISGKKQIESLKPTVRESIIEFNRLCKQSVWQYKDEWETLTRRMGYWVDMENPYITYHNNYIESSWAIMKEAWQKDLVYLGHKVLPYCTRCGTALSSHEVAQGYKTVKDNSVYVKFELEGEPKTYILSWTTTPWTLPGNVALAVGKDIDYVEVDKQGENADEKYILAKELLGVLGEGVAASREYKGADLVGKSYKPLFNVPSLKSDKSYQVHEADFVTTTDGTGVVHTAVMYGEDDYKLGEKLGLPKFHTVDETGNFVAEVEGLAGKYVKQLETEIDIFKALKAGNNLLRKQKYEHEYPHCWRCSTPLLYYARDSWFIRMSALREDLIKNNEQIDWNPDYIKYGRFGEWLSEVKDWAISRERYWGTPLPIWECQTCKAYQVVGSVAELNLNKNHFFFARHGEAESNIQGIHSNWPEVRPFPLTETGKGNARAMGNAVKALGGVDMIYASDLMRTTMTAEIASEILGVPVKFDERLREYNLGVFNGHPLEEFHKQWPVQQRWQGAPEGGESYMQLQNRMLDFVAEMNTHHNGKRILVVTHADVIWLLNQHYDLDNRYPQVGEFTEMEIGLTDLHRPYVDEIKLPCRECGGESKRVTAVMDVWFDSGAMPYAQWHYPFENKALAEAQFPADYICEAIDQTRGWFYTLLAISTVLGKGPSFKHVISLGHLLDDKGQKMSKSRGNVIDPWAIINKYGIDSVRWYMYSTSQPGDTKMFGERDLELIIRKNFLTLWNVLSFFVTYSKYDNWTAEDKQVHDLDVLDQWIMAKTQELVNDVTKSLDGYDPFRAARRVEEFISELSTWYVRRSRDRKGAAVYQTLYNVLKTLSMVMAPFTPYLAESVWQQLRAKDDAESVHLAYWPETTPSVENEKLLKDMDWVRRIVENGLAFRKASNIKVRQPLAGLKYWIKDDLRLDPSFEKIVADELNLKSVVHDASARPSSGDFGAQIDTAMTAELKVEGLARELERAVQDMRKKTGLQVGEFVNLAYDTSDEDLQKALKLFDVKKTFVKDLASRKIDPMQEFSVDGKTILLGLEK